MVKRRPNDREDAATKEEREARVNDMIARAKRAHPGTAKKATRKPVKASKKR